MSLTELMNQVWPVVREWLNLRSLRERNVTVAKLEEKCAGFSRGLGGREERECFFEGSGLELEEDYDGDEGSYQEGGGELGVVSSGACRGNIGDRRK